LQRQFDRPARRPRAERSEDGVGTDKQLAAKTAADVRRHKTDILFRHAKRLGDIAVSPGNHLVRRIERQLIAFPAGGRSMRLHHRMRLIGRAVGRIEADRRRHEGASEIANRGLRRSVDSVGLGFRRGVLAGGQIERTIAVAVVDKDQLRRGTRLFECLSDDDRDGLMVVLDIGAAEQLCRVVVTLFQLAGIIRRDDRQHTGRSLRRGQINRDDAAFSDRRPYHIAIGRVGDFVMSLIGVTGRSGCLQWAVDTVGRMADDLELVDRIKGCWIFEFHNLTLCFRQHGRERALDQRQLECIFLCRAGAV